MADLLTAGFAVDDYAKVMVEHEASLVYEASPWAVDKRAAEIVRPAPVQSADRVPPKSLARDMAFAAKLQSRILSAAEAVQAAKSHGDMHPEQQAVMFSAGGPGTGTCWTAMHNTDRTGTECAVEDGNGAATRRDTRCRPALCGKEMMGTSEKDLWLSTLSTFFCCQYGGARTRPRRAVQHTLRRLIEQAGGYADVERHVPELPDCVSNDNDAAPEMRCAILGVVFWFPGVLQQLVRSLVLDTYGRLGGEGTKLLRDLVTTAAANGQCSPHAVGRWRTQLERVLLAAQADTYLRALGSRFADRPASEPPLLLAEQSVHSFCLFGGACRATLMWRFV